MNKSIRSYLILVAIAIAAGMLALHAPIAQPLGYHDFADRRQFLKVPNALNVLSNVFFFVVGWWGLHVTFRGLASNMWGGLMAERWAYAVLFAGVALTCFGSGYYHMQPSNSRLMWDRLPMAVGFMGLLAATTIERIRVDSGLRVLVQLVLLGVVSVIYWHVSESCGRGDLRLYFAVQYGSLLVILALVAFVPSRYSHSGFLLVAILLYASAKVLEAYDREIFAATGLVSGHALKHLVAAGAPVMIILMLSRRKYRGR